MHQHGADQCEMSCWLTEILLTGCCPRPSRLNTHTQHTRRRMSVLHTTIHCFTQVYFSRPAVSHTSVSLYVPCSTTVWLLDMFSDPAGRAVCRSVHLDSPDVWVIKSACGAQRPNTLNVSVCV